jgi:hypothetical protein
MNARRRGCALLAVLGPEFSFEYSHLSEARGDSLCLESAIGVAWRIKVQAAREVI